ncbi:MAG: hypothetical protein AMXMBFR13_06880 [Phycisphaerae bacterium]
MSTCPYGAYAPFDPGEDATLERLRGLCICEDCVEDRRRWFEDQPALILGFHPDDLEDDLTEVLREGVIA